MGTELDLNEDKNQEELLWQEEAKSLRKYRQYRGNDQLSNFNSMQLAEIRKGLESGVEVEQYATNEYEWFEMEEIRTCLEERFPYKKYIDDGFDRAQIREIRLGMAEGLDVSLYLKTEYFGRQMGEIRRGLEEGLDVSAYLNPNFNWFQMEEIRKGLEQGIKVSFYASTRFDHLQMREMRLALEDDIDLTRYVISGMKGPELGQVRKALENQIDISSYALEKYDAEQLYEIRKAKEDDINIDPFVNKQLCGTQIHEIALGLTNQVDVTVYATGEYNWFQMREIRLALEHRLDVELLARPLLTWQQMEQIRLGLEENLVVSVYSRLYHSAEKMREKRLALKNHEQSSEDHLNEPIAEIQERLQLESMVEINVSQDAMHAVMIIHQKNLHKKFDKQEIMHLLSNKRIIYGVKDDVITDILKNGKYNLPFEIATGNPPLHGRDGSYEYFFRTLPDIQPKLLPDGSVDYSELDSFETVSIGQTIAEYHDAVNGVNGTDIYGRELKARDGMNLPMLTGKGFTMLPDKIHYVATLRGKITLDNYHMEISRVYVIDGNVDVSTGNLHYDGDIMINGDVTSGMVVEVTGSVDILGNVESATIICGGDLMIRKGMLGNFQGKLQVGGLIQGNFFESAVISAKGNIFANYLLNSEIFTMGKLTVSGRKGSIIGGNSQAVRGIYATQIGNRAEIPTMVGAGYTEIISEQCEQLNRKVSKLDGELRIFEDGREKLEKRINGSELFKNETYVKILQAIEMKQTEKKQVCIELKKMEQLVSLAKNTRIVARGSIYPGVKVGIDTYHYAVRDRGSGVYFLHKGNHVAAYKL